MEVMICAALATLLAVGATRAAMTTAAVARRERSRHRDR